MANVVSFAKIEVHLKFENEKCKLSEILNISLVVIFQLKNASVTGQALSPIYLHNVDFAKLLVYNHL